MAIENRLDVFVYAIQDRYYGISGHPNLLQAVAVVWKKREIIARHTATCVHRGTLQALARHAYDLMWPNACKECDASGWIGEDPCHCLESGCCPRCGSQLGWDVATFNKWLESNNPCPFCGWSHGSCSMDTRPPSHQCYCWEGLRLWS